MSTTDEQAARETPGTPALNEALAVVQAKLPKITKGRTVKVPGKDGKAGYEYKYAELDDVSAAILPLLGQNGLSFTAKPTLNSDGKFVLAYSLKHSSGEHDDGEFPLVGANSPQQVGSLITYARRYCLCSVTGIAPDRDDDGAAAEHGNREEDWRSQPPVSRPRSGDGNGHVSRPAQPAQQTTQAPAEGTGTDPDPDAQGYADQAAEARSLDALRAIHKEAFDAGKLGAVIRNPATGNTGPLGPYLEWRRKQLTDDTKAWKELQDAAVQMSSADLEAHVKKVTGSGIEGATAAQLRAAAEALKAKAGA